MQIIIHKPRTNTCPPVLEGTRKSIIYSIFFIKIVTIYNKEKGIKGVAKGDRRGRYRERV